MKIVLAAIASLFLVACSGPYGELAEEFDREPRGLRGLEELSAKTIVLVSPNRAGTYNYIKMMNIGLLSTSVYVRPRAPFNTVMSNLWIPASAIDACSRSCLAPTERYTGLVMAGLGVELNIPNAPEVLEWCWNNEIPILPFADRKAWLVQRASLPDKSVYAGQFASREAYDEQVKLSCAGE